MGHENGGWMNADQREASECDGIEAAVKRLARSDKGLGTMRRVLEWMENEGLSLDSQNKEAILYLIEMCWQRPGSTRDAMRVHIPRAAEVAS